jgi:dTDP-glucose 4,6-dehydratase
VRDWLYVEDHCSALLTILERGTVGEKYNVGGSNERTNLELVDLLCAELESVRPAAQNPALQAAGIAHYTALKHFVTDRPGHDRRYAIDSTKLQRELRWQPECDLQRGLARTVRWYLDHLGWCHAVQEGSYRRERLGAQSA